MNVTEQVGEPAPPGEERLLTGWGRTGPSRARVSRPRSPAELERLLEAPAARGTIARGLGRCYGDAAQRAGGHVIAATGLAYLRDWDDHGGRVTVGAGLSLAALIATALPRGFFIPVSPGTRYITVGGAIAADIHGKNHHRDGSFADHVESLLLRTPGGALRELTRDGSHDEFVATAGGMGLTGVIVEATLRLLPVETARVRVDTERASDLDDVMARMEAGDAAYRYSVAWIDTLARGASLGRSILMRGDHARREELGPEDRGHDGLPRSPRLAAPRLPFGVLGRPSVRAFNELWFRKAPRCERGRIDSLESFFFPLDAVRGWNRLYGRRGFLQYQLVLPFGEEAALRRVLERVSDSRSPSFLAVLKRFGDQRGIISFPMPGWTLALDMPAADPQLATLLDGLDELVAGAGGRVYLAKDSRLRPELLDAMYPQLPRWRELRDRLDPERRMRSDLAARLGLT